MYSHWQSATFIRVTCGVVLALLLLIALPNLRGLDPVSMVALGIAAGLVLIVLITFHGLGIEVSADAVEVWFGPGWIRRTLATGDIRGVREVRNGWWMGWGIRWVGRHTILWNVSGLDAVELELLSGRRFRIGTDDPAGLVAALRRAKSS